MAAISPLAASARRLVGKVALITGAASGIGASTAKLFAQHGAKVVLAGIHDELGQGVVESLGPNESTYVHCNVTNESHISNAVDKAVKKYGKLDIMFNNTEIVDPKPRIMNIEKADFNRLVNINVMGVFLGMKHAARVMVPAGSGSIISTASVSSVPAGTGSHTYCSSKHAVIGLTRNLAVELGQFGIRVNCLSPSGCACATPLGNDFTGLNDEEFEAAMNNAANLKGVTFRRDDIANAALYLVSDDAKYISGHNLVLDGGSTVVNPSFNMFQYPENSSRSHSSHSS